jgi:hypothetical protein
MEDEDEENTEDGDMKKNMESGMKHVYWDETWSTKFLFVTLSQRSSQEEWAQLSFLPMCHHC